MGQEIIQTRLKRGGKVSSAVEAKDKKRHTDPREIPSSHTTMGDIVQPRSRP